MRAFSARTRRTCAVVAHEHPWTCRDRPSRLPVVTHTQDGLLYRKTAAILTEKRMRGDTLSPSRECQMPELPIRTYLGYKWWTIRASESLCLPESQRTLDDGEINEFAPHISRIDRERHLRVVCGMIVERERVCVTQLRYTLVRDITHDLENKESLRQKSRLSSERTHNAAFS